MLRCIAIVGLLLLTPALTLAQGTGPDEITRQVLPGNVGPYQGASSHERYHYGSIQPFPMFMNARSAHSFYDLEYLDRLDRQEKFGHRWPSAKYGSEFQVNRINREYVDRSERIERSRGRFLFSGGAFFGRWR
jgi:hypothetical protein